MKYATCSNMDGSVDDHTKWSKAEKDKHHMIPFAYGILKNDKMNLFAK